MQPVMYDIGLDGRTFIPTPGDGPALNFTANGGIAPGLLCYCDSPGTYGLPSQLAGVFQGKSDSVVVHPQIRPSMPASIITAISLCAIIPPTDSRLGRRL